MSDLRRPHPHQPEPPLLELSELGRTHPVLHGAGELDSAVAERLRALLDTACERQIEALLLDFAEVELLDARLLGLIEAARARLAARGVPLRIVAGAQPRRLLSVTGMDERIPTLGAGLPHRLQPWPPASSSSRSPTRTSAPNGVTATQ